MGRFRRWSWPLTMLLLPLVLMGWASVQGWRADDVLREAQIMRQWLASPSDAWVQQLSRDERKQVISPEGRRTHFQSQVDKVDSDHAWIRLRQALAALAYWLAFAALVAGPATWLKLRVDAWRALSARDFLYDRLFPCWRALGRWLVAYTALLVGALALSLLYELSWGWSHFKAGGWFMLLVAVPVIAVLWIGLMLIERLRQQWHALDSPSSAFLGQAMGRDKAPALWAWIELLAADTGAPMPDHIVIGIDQSFFVTSVDVVLQPAGDVLRGRTLYLPLTYLTTMSQVETASIIGHELGHFSSRDTERGSEIGAYFNLMCLHFSFISAADADPAWIERPAIWMTQRFLHHFQVAVHHWGRAQELVADRVGSKIAGERLFCQALLRVIALDGEIDTLLAERRHANLIQALAEHLRHTPLRLSDTVLQHAIAHPFDTHPPTALRLRQLGVALDASLLAQATRTPTEHDCQWFSQLTASPSPQPDANDVRHKTL
ncbi:M48 family metallopeptidase [Pseudomonas citrulli]|uniref:M48 family metallopeptidase n=1 Tax=Pseudomonas citrulli TaxID=3064347 RepID=A0ABT9BWF1_9PSED|nr:M48 family metallopeptidase [Pseudomonas sp. K18]MDO7896885.1 M48 family metallopeptidase [Pseudomonas sp. K18]